MKRMPPHAAVLERMDETAIVRQPFFDFDELAEILREDGVEAAGLRLLDTWPRLQLAIAASSPQFSVALEAAATSRAIADLCLPVLRFAMRASTKSTPLGLFAGPARAHWSDTADARDRRAEPDVLVRIGGKRLYDRIREHRTPGAPAGLVFASSLVLEARSLLIVLRPALPVERAAQTEPYSHVDVSLIPNNAAVRRVRELAAGGISRALVMSSLAAEFGVPAQTAADLVARLENGGLLIEGPLPLTSEALADFLERFPDDAAAGAIRHDLARGEAVRRTLEDAWHARSAPAHVLESVRDVARAGYEIEATSRAAVALPAFIRRDLDRLARYAFRTAAIVDSERFRAAVTSLFEGRDRVVPVLALAALDLQLPLEREYRSGGEEERLQIVARWALACARTANVEKVLTDDEVEQLLPEPRYNGERASFELAFRVLQPAGAALPARILARPFSSTHAEMSLGRWRDVIPAASHDESEDDAIDAEMVYIPAEARHYNLQARRHLTRYVVCLAPGGADVPGAQVITADDLLVRIVDDRLTLWSRRLGRRIRLVETSAYNSDRYAPYVVRLLLAISRDGTTDVVGFRIPHIERLPFVPRLRTGNIVLYPAQWTFRASELLLDLNSAADLRARYGIPRYAFLKIGNEQKTFVDLHSSVSRELVIPSLRHAKESTVYLSEAHPYDEERLCRPFDEYLVSYRVRPAKRRPPPALGNAVFPAQMWPKPDERWIYFEYHAPRVAHRPLLLNNVEPLMTELRAEGSLDAWFFARYVGPTWHLRVRVLPAQRRTEQVRVRLRALGAELQFQGWILGWAEKQYYPEVERYGGDSVMPHVERHFAESSAAVLAALRAGPVGASAAAASFLPLARTLRDLRRYCSLADDDREHVAAAQIDEALAIAATSDTGTLREAEQAADALGTDFDPVFRACFHMHCNRCGIADAEEQRARNVLNRLAASLLARRASDPRAR